MTGQGDFGFPEEVDEPTKAELLRQEAQEWSDKADRAGNNTTRVFHCAWEQIRCENEAAALEGEA